MKYVCCFLFIYTGSEIPKLSALGFTKPLLFMLYVGNSISNKGVMADNFNYFSHFLNFWMKKDMNENSL